MVTFVVCVRSANLRNLEGIRSDLEKEPHSYPFKLTLDDLRKRQFRYQCKLSNYEMSEFGVVDDWSEILRAVELTIPTWLNTYSHAALAKEIEKIWLEDLSSTK